MSKFFDDTMQGLLESVEIEKGNTPLKENMPAPTFYAADKEGKAVVGKDDEWRNETE